MDKTTKPGRKKFRPEETIETGLYFDDIFYDFLNEFAHTYFPTKHHFNRFFSSFISNNKCQIVDILTKYPFIADLSRGDSYYTFTFSEDEHKMLKSITSEPNITFNSIVKLFIITLMFKPYGLLPQHLSIRIDPNSLLHENPISFSRYTYASIVKFLKTNPTPRTTALLRHMQRPDSSFSDIVSLYEEVYHSVRRNPQYSDFVSIFSFYIPNMQMFISELIHSIDLPKLQPFVKDIDTLNLTQRLLFDNIASYHLPVFAASKFVLKMYKIYFAFMHHKFRSQFFKKPKKDFHLLETSDTNEDDNTLLLTEPQT